MNAAAKVLKYEWSDVLRSKWILLYAGFFLLLTEALLRFEGGSPRVLLSLMNVTLIVVPLVSIVFGTMYVYQARDFIELLLAQPVQRGRLFAGLYGGLALPLAGAYALGIALPFLWHGAEGGVYAPLVMLEVAGILLTLIFIALALLVAVRFEEKVRGLGVALVLWLLTTVIYDGLVLLVLHAFADYPLETPALVLTVLNPVDLARVLLLLQFDIAALMGYTGAVFEAFFGGAWGLAVSLGALTAWIAAPAAVALALFRRKDF